MHSSLLKLRTLSAALATAAAILPQAGSGRAWDIVVPPNMPDSDALKAEIWDFFLHGLAPGERLVLYDGMDGREMLRIAIPADRRFEEERVRTKALRSRDGAAVAGDRRALGPGEPGAPYRIDFPGLATNTPRPGRPARASFSSSPRGCTFRIWTPASASGSSGPELFLPTDAHIEAPLSESPYGTRGLETALDGVVVHICLRSDGSRLTTHQKDELRRFWSLYVQRLGGTLATFTESLPAASTAGAPGCAAARCRGGPRHREPTFWRCAGSRGRRLRTRRQPLNPSCRRASRSSRSLPRSRIPASAASR
jgi:hypothetical protein